MDVNLKCGYVHPETGLVYIGKQKSCKDGLRWCSPEKYEERKKQSSECQSRPEYREVVKSRRNTDLERSKRNAYQRKRTVEKSKFRGKNIEGMTFGRLTAVSVAGSRDYGDGDPYHGGKKRLWLCKCSCGNTAEVTTGNLLKKDGTKSCGCLHKETSADNSKKSRDKIVNPEAGLNRVLGIYKLNARKRNLEWKLDKASSVALILSSCHYCGSPPANKIKGSRGSVFAYNGIDRVNNSDGYTVENTVSCCSICNHAKHTLSSDVFTEWILKAANHLNAANGLLK